MPEHRIVTRLRELMVLGLTAEEAYTVHFGLIAPHLADAGTHIQSRLRSEADRVFKATGTQSLHELFAFLEAET